MKTVGVIVLSLIIALMAGCQKRVDPRLADSSDISYEEPSPAVTEEVSYDTIETLLNRYIVPYEHFAAGQAWDFSNPYYENYLDYDDINNNPMDRDSIILSFAHHVLTRQLPESSRQRYIAEWDEPYAKYLMPAGFWEAVGGFYFNTRINQPQDITVLSRIENGMPWPDQDNEDIAIYYNSSQILPNGDIKIIVDRYVGGRPLMQGEYVFRPYGTLIIPAELRDIFSSGDTAYYFISIQDIYTYIEARTVEIRTPDDLRNMAWEVNSGDYSYLNTTYLLANDIDMTGEVMEPVGQYITKYPHEINKSGFGAIFDGQGHTVKGITISVECDDVQKEYSTGLFSVVASGGVVRNLNVTGAEITFTLRSQPIGANATGGLAGTNYGLIDNCSFSGKVTGNTNVGGLVGIAGSRSVIQNCAVDSVVKGTEDVGAFAGLVHNAQITDSRAQGEVNSARTVPGNNDTPRGIGGFVGSSISGTIHNCRSSVSVLTNVSSNWVGAFIGHSQHGYITACLYDSNRTHWNAVGYNRERSTSVDIQGVSRSQLGL